SATDLTAAGMASVPAPSGPVRELTSVPKPAMAVRSPVGSVVTGSPAQPSQPGSGVATSSRHGGHAGGQGRAVTPVTTSRMATAGAGCPPGGQRVATSGAGGTPAWPTRAG